MAHRALDFALGHPSTDASYTALVARLQDRVGRADALTVQQQEGHTGEGAARGQRDAIKRALRVQLRHLVLVADVAVKERPDLFKAFVFPDLEGPQRELITAAKAMLPAAIENKDVLISVGLGDTFIDDLTKAIAAFDQATATGHDRREDHVGARADLRGVTTECVKLVRVIDGLYRIRFQGDVESLTAWKAASHVAGPFRKKKGDAGADPAPEPGVGPAPVPGPSPMPVQVQPVVGPGPAQGGVQAGAEKRSAGA